MPTNTTDSRLDPARVPAAWTIAILSSTSATALFPPDERPLRLRGHHISALVKLTLALLAGLVVAALSARLGDVCMDAASLACGP